MIEYIYALLIFLVRKAMIYMQQPFFSRIYNIMKIKLSCFPGHLNATESNILSPLSALFQLTLHYLELW